MRDMFRDESLPFDLGKKYDSYFAADIITA